MDCLAHTWICSGCSRQHVGTPALPPPDWEWHGSRLLCDDCSGNTPSGEADTHAPPEGYIQALPVFAHGDRIPDNVPCEAIGRDAFPATIFAMNVIRMDSGGPSWPADDAPSVPLCWHPFLPVIESGLATLDGGDRSKLDLDGEMFTFCAGEEGAMQAIRDRSQSLGLASLFLNDFFEGWTHVALDAALADRRSDRVLELLTDARNKLHDVAMPDGLDPDAALECAARITAEIGPQRPRDCIPGTDNDCCTACSTGGAA